MPLQRSHLSDVSSGTMRPTFDLNRQIELTHFLRNRPFAFERANFILLLCFVRAYGRWKHSRVRAFGIEDMLCPAYQKFFYKDNLLYELMLRSVTAPIRFPC